MQEKLLDIGCGSGQELDRIRGIHEYEVFGIDIDSEALEKCKEKYPSGVFRKASATNIPFESNVFDLVISSVALPYTDIPAVLKEVFRVLKPNGEIFFTLHSFDMTFMFFRHYLIRGRVKPTLFTIYALINGLYFHFFGGVFHFPFYPQKYESFQTARGVRKAMRRSGLQVATVYRDNKKLCVTGVKPGSASPSSP